jgi:hypothetical protein
MYSWEKCWLQRPVKPWVDAGERYAKLQVTLYDIYDECSGTVAPFRPLLLLFPSCFNIRSSSHRVFRRIIVSPLQLLRINTERVSLRSRLSVSAGADIWTALSRPVNFQSHFSLKLLVGQHLIEGHLWRSANFRTPCVLCMQSIYVPVSNSPTCIVEHCLSFVNACLPVSLHVLLCFGFW